MGKRFFLVHAWLWIKCSIAHISFYILNCGVTFLGALVLPVLYLGPLSWTYIIARWWCKRLLTHARWCLGINWKTQDFPVLVSHSRLLVACAHQSAWETLVLNLLLKNPAFVLKNTLMHAPVLGAFFHRMKMIPIHRGRSVSKLFLQNAQNVLEQGRPIVIFPEGQRVPFGRPVRCHRGTFFLYQTLQVPVLALSVNSGFFWPPRRFFKRSGCIILKAHPLIEPGLDEEAFNHTLRNLLQKGNEVLYQQIQQSNPLKALNNF